MMQIMRRRAFITLLGGAAAGWPLAARAQQRQGLRRIALFAGILNDPNDAVILAAPAAFAEALAQAGWVEGRNISIERRFPVGDSGRIRSEATDVIARSPDAIVCVGTQSTGIVKQLTSTIPIVFVNVADPVASGFVASFAHPGGNITGFTSVQFSLAGKWLSLLRYIAPGVRNVMLLYDPNNPNWQGFLQTLEAAAPTVGVSARAAPAASIGEIERQIESSAHEPAAGMIVVPGAATINNREMIAALAVRHRLPAIYPYKMFATSGGLASYGFDFSDGFRGAANYVNLILKGTKPADLPVQAPTKFEFVINLKAATAIGLTVSTSVQLLADDVIE